MSAEQKKISRGRIEAGILIGAIIGMATFGLIVGTILEAQFLWLVITALIGAGVGLMVALNLNKKDPRLNNKAHKKG